MKPIQILHAAMALALSATPLLAQDKQPNPSPRPPQGEGHPSAPEGRSKPEHGSMHGFFARLDANRDGAIDQTELAQAGEILRKLDRNNDGRITPGEMRPGGDSQRPPGGRERPAANHNASPEKAGQRPEARHDGQQAEGPRNPIGPESGPRREGLKPSPREGDAGRGGPPGPPPSGAQPQQHGDRSAHREMRPDFGRGNSRAPWQQAFRKEEAGPRGPLASAAGQGDRREMHRGPANLRPEIRHDLGNRGPQGGRGEFRPPGRGLENPMPPRGERSGPPQHDGSKGRDEVHRPGGAREGHRDLPPHHPPQGERGPRDPAPSPRDLQ